jgi:hypothetical protein
VEWRSRETRARPHRIVVHGSAWLAYHLHVAQRHPRSRDAAMKAWRRGMEASSQGPARSRTTRPSGSSARSQSGQSIGAPTWSARPTESRILYGSLRVGTAGSGARAISCAPNEHIGDASFRQSGIGESDFVVHRRVASNLVQSGDQVTLEYRVSLSNGDSGVGVLIPGEQSGRSRQRLSGGFAAKG